VLRMRGRLHLATLVIGMATFAEQYGGAIIAGATTADRYQAGQSLRLGHGPAQHVWF